MGLNKIIYSQDVVFEILKESNTSFQHMHIVECSYYGVGKITYLHIPFKQALFKMQMYCSQFNTQINLSAPSSLENTVSRAHKSTPKTRHKPSAESLRHII